MTKDAIRALEATKTLLLALRTSQIRGSEFNRVLRMIDKALGEE